IIHGIIGKKKMSKFPESINHGPELVSDRPGIANVFNKHFANVGVSTVKESVAANNSEQRNKFEDYLPPSSLSSLFLTPTSKEELINIVNLLKPDPEEIQSIDEQMIPFKGRIEFRQYLKDKPNSWGVKVFTRAGISGIVCDIEVYTGKGSVEISELGQGTGVVLWLV
ncbi:hypothetical protein QYM36_018107, partial [Artemia franciscana]